MKKKQMPIYTIITLGPVCDKPNSSIPGFSYTRIVGFQYNIEDAKEIVENNLCDLNEAGYYPYALIEKTEPGLYGITNERFFYEYDRDTDTYKECPELACMKHICGYGIG